MLGPEAVESRWKCSVDEYLPTENARRNLVDEYERPSGVEGGALVALAAETLQVIDGRFEAFRRGETEPWLRLDAIDSSYWEVFAPNGDDLVQFRLTFHDVEDL